MQLSKSYLKGQIDLYKKISKESLIKLQKYSFDNDIVLDFPSRSIQTAQLQRAQQNANKQFANLSYFVETDSGLENTRVSAANKIKNIDIQLAKIYELDKEKLIPEYVISIMPSDYNPGLKKQLNQIETEIVIMKSKYTSKDPNVLRLEDSKSKMINLLKEKAIQFLKAEKISTQALMESVTRPKEVLIKYKELFRSAERDQMTLVQLENDLRVVNLQDARLEDPWKLITEPTLNKYPVGIAKRYILLIGIGLGIFFGIIIAYLKEKFSDIIFNKED